MLKRVALALIACLWASLVFGQAPPRGLQQSETGAGNAGYPPGSTPVSTAAAGTTAGTTATLPSAPGQYTYLCGFTISPGSATAAITIGITITNTLGGLGAPNLFVGVPVTAAGTTGATLSQTFPECLRSLAVNQTIVVSAGALGTGGVNQTVNAWGYQE